MVEAEYNGLWGPPSEEDSAVPQVGAIPWDTQDPDQIIPAIRNLMSPPYGYLVALSPDGLLYTEDAFGNRLIRPAPYRYNPSASHIEDAEGNVVAPLQQTDRDAESNTGPYRRITTRSDLGCTGAVVMFYVPPPTYVYSRYINVPQQTHGSTRDTPYVYLGMRYGGTDMEGGISFHPAGRGIRKNNNEWSDRDGTIPAPNYDRWQPYLKTSNRKFPIGFEEIGVPFNHIRYDNAPYGLIVRLRLVHTPREKGVEFKVKVWAAVFDDTTEDPRLIYDFYGFADVKPPANSVKVRRVISIAQKNPSNSYQRTGSFFEYVGVGYQPLFDVGDLLFTAQVYCRPFYRLWTGDISDPPTNFPPLGNVVTVRVIEAYHKEVVHINLR